MKRLCQNKLHSKSFLSNFWGEVHNPNYDTANFVIYVICVMRAKDSGGGNCRCACGTDAPRLLLHL